MHLLGESLGGSPRNLSKSNFLALGKVGQRDSSFVDFRLLGNAAHMSAFDTRLDQMLGAPSKPEFSAIIALSSGPGDDKLQSCLLGECLNLFDIQDVPSMLHLLFACVCYTVCICLHLLFNFFLIFVPRCISSALGNIKAPGSSLTDYVSPRFLPAVPGGCSS